MVGGGAGDEGRSKREEEREGERERSTLISLYSKLCTAVTINFGLTAPIISLIVAGVIFWPRDLVIAVSSVAVIISSPLLSL